ncbi:MAG TPA: hypothetical protein VFD92_26910 [Candidatus Binatia bacterium]|nr:hypothetical protein [Candidatus Binatia bacterium]
MKLIASIIATLVLPSIAFALGTLEVPRDKISGINVVAGWKCPPTGNLTVQFDDTTPLPLVKGVSRPDTGAACGNSGANGFLAEFNYALLGDGHHTARVFDNGVQFDMQEFDVVRLGQSFRQGLSGSFTVNNFPSTGDKTTLTWSTGLQGFVISDFDPAGPNPTPTPGPTGLAGLIGTWDFTYTIISTFTDRYRLQNVQEQNGLQLLFGLDEFGGQVAVGRVQDVSPGSTLPYEFILADPGPIICQGFAFNRTGPINAVGIYAQFNASCSAIISNRYAMTGVRVSTTALTTETPTSLAGADVLDSLRLAETRAAESGMASRESVDADTAAEMSEVMRALTGH